MCVIPGSEVHDPNSVRERVRKLADGFKSAELYAAAEFLGAVAHVIFAQESEIEALRNRPLMVNSAPDYAQEVKNLKETIQILTKAKDEAERVAYDRQLLMEKAIAVLE